MRKTTVSVEQVKQGVRALIGKPIKVKINRGRKRIERYCGEISAVYPSVFTLKVEKSAVKSLSCSYSDLICGEVVIKRNTNN